MIVDRRKDQCDELLLLGRDARISRARTNRWTTLLVVGAMAASAAYVAATNNQVEELRKAKDAADNEVVQLNIELGRLEFDHAALRVERDVYKENAEWFATMAPQLNASNRLGDIANALGGTDTTGRDPVVQTSDFALSNLVWYVDGSRRFPMTAHDVLWIPEGRFWVRLEDPGSPSVAPTQVKIYEGIRPSVPDPNADRDEVEEADKGEGPYELDLVKYYERELRQGGSDCVRLHLDSMTRRQAFGAGYVDMVVEYSNNPDCKTGTGELRLEEPDDD